MKKFAPLLYLLIIASCSKKENVTVFEEGSFKIVIEKGDSVDQTSVLAVFISDSDAKIIINGTTQSSFTEGVQLDQVAGNLITGETDVKTRTMSLGLNVRANGDFETASLSIKFYFNNQLKHEKQIIIPNDDKITDYLFSLDVQNNLELDEKITVL